MEFADVDAARRRPWRASATSPTAGSRCRVYLALTLRRPLLLEGEPGVGKTEVARTLARVLAARLIRLQCYEGIDAGQALYEWNYSRQLLYARTLQEGALDPDRKAAELYGPEFLVERPLLARRARGRGGGAAGGRAGPRRRGVRGLPARGAGRRGRDDPGDRHRRRRATPPVVVLTSNRTRELHDALKRRCLYHWIDYPDREREVQIIRLRAPEASEALAESVAELVGAAALARPRQAPRPRRGDRLDAGAGGARHRLRRRRLGRRDARLGGEGPRRPGDRAAGAAGAAGRMMRDGAEPLDRIRDLAEALRAAGVPVGTGRLLGLARRRRGGGARRPLLGRAGDAHLAPRGPGRLPPRLRVGVRPPRPAARRSRSRWPTGAGAP